MFRSPASGTAEDDAEAEAEAEAGSAVGDVVTVTVESACGVVWELESLELVEVELAVTEDVTMVVMYVVGLVLRVSLVVVLEDVETTVLEIEEVDVTPDEVVEDAVDVMEVLLEREDDDDVVSVDEDAVLENELVSLDAVELEAADDSSVPLGCASCAYPNKPWSKLPHESDWKPGHPSLQLSTLVVSEGLMFEHQQFFPCMIA